MAQRVDAESESAREFFLCHLQACADRLHVDRSAVSRQRSRVAGLSEVQEPDTVAQMPVFTMPASLSRGTMPDKIGLFEMRRLEALSNTIFGVAMTLLAYDLPKLSGVASAPSWADIYHTYAQHVSALMLSFIIAGIFWFSHQRRLVAAPEAARGTVFLNLIFLLSIIVLPATNGLLGTYGTSSGVVAVIYGAHLTLIAALNALLWLIAVKGRGHWEILAPAIFSFVVFLLGTAVAVVAPKVAPYLWYLGFFAPLIGRLGRGRAASSPPA
jgi:uncharacterized membrane protein